MMMIHFLVMGWVTIQRSCKWVSTWYHRPFAFTVAGDADTTIRHKYGVDLPKWKEIFSCDQLSTVEGRRFLAVPVRNKNEWRKRWRYGFLSFLLFSFCSLVWIPVSPGCSGPCASICGNFFIVQVITMKMAAAQRTHENGSQVASFEVKHTGTTVYIIMNNHTCIYIYIYV